MQAKKNVVRYCNLPRRVNSPNPGHHLCTVSFRSGCSRLWARCFGWSIFSTRRLQPRVVGHRCLTQWNKLQGKCGLIQSITCKWRGLWNGIAHRGFNIVIATGIQLVDFYLKILARVLTTSLDLFDFLIIGGAKRNGPWFSGVALLPHQPWHRP